MKRALEKNSSSGYREKMVFALMLAAFLLVSWSVIICAQDAPWPMFRHDAQRTGLSSLSGPSIVLLKWSFRTNIGDPAMVSSSPALSSADAVYTGSGDNTIYCLDSNGLILWSYATAAFVESSLALGVDAIYVGSADNRLYSLDAQAGSLSWSYQTGDIMYSSPALSEIDAVFVGSEDNIIYCIESIGSLRWSYRTGGGIRSSPAIGAQNVCVGSEDTNLYSLDAQIGSLSWSFKTGGLIFSSPALSATDTVYVGSDILYSIDSIGSLRWDFVTGSGIESSPAIGVQNVWVGSKDNCLYSIDMSGTLFWSFRTGGQILSSPALGSAETVYIGSSDTILYSILANGQLEWSYRTAEPVTSSIAIGADAVYLDSDDGTLRVLAGPTATPFQGGHLWPMFHHDLKHTGKTVMDGPAQPFLMWSYVTGNAVYSPPVVSASGDVYISAEDLNMYKLTPSGALSWSYMTTESIGSAQAIDADRVYAGSFNNVLYAFNSSGGLFWSYASGGDFDLESSPMVSADGIWIGSNDEQFYRIQKNGQLSWSYRFGGDINSSAALSGSNTLFVGSNDNCLYSLAQSGLFLWSYRTADLIPDSPSLDASDTVYIGSFDNRLYSIDSTGALVWSYEAGGNFENGMAAAIGTSTVYIGCSDNRLYNVSMDGQLQWSYETHFGIISSPALGSTEAVYVGSLDGQLYNIGAGGALSWSFDARASIYSSPAIGSDTVYVASAGAYSNVLYAISGPPTATPSPVPPTPTPTCLPLTVFLNNSSFNPGETLEVRIIFNDTIMDWDGYLVFARNGRTWSVVRGKLQRGVHPVLTNRLEIHYCWGPNKVFSTRVPRNAAGLYTLYAVIMPTGTKPTYANAIYGPFSLHSIAVFRILS